MKLSIVALLSFVFIGSFIGSFIVGCASPGSATIAWSRSKDVPKLIHAHPNGYYGIYTPDGTAALWSGMLEAGDDYGFMKADTGRVVGVIKRKSGQMTTIPLDTWYAETYSWKFEGDKKKM